MKMVDKIETGFAVVALAAAALFAVGCAGETNEEAAPSALQETRVYDGVTVVGEQAADGSIRIEPKSPSGAPLMSLVVHGDLVEVQPIADVKLAPWTGTIPATAHVGGLAYWSYVAYAYSQGIKAPRHSTPGGELSPRMMSAGTDGAMCIAAGSTAMECAYWRYCRSNWCPFW
jgi:hypothetical protein